MSGIHVPGVRRGRLCGSNRAMLSPAVPGQEAQQRYPPGWGAGSAHKLLSTDTPFRLTCSSCCRKQCKQLTCSRRRWGFWAPCSPQLEQGLSEICTPFQGATISESVPAVMLCTQGCAGSPGQPSDFEPNSGGASCHLNPQSRRSCERTFALLLLRCTWAFLLLYPWAQLQPAAGRPPPCTQARLSSSLHYKPALVLLVLAVFLRLEQIPFFFFFPKSILRSVSPSLPSLYHFLDCWSTAALPQLFIHTPILPLPSPPCLGLAGTPDTASELGNRRAAPGSKKEAHSSKASSIKRTSPSVFNSEMSVWLLAAISVQWARSLDHGYLSRWTCQESRAAAQRHGVMEKH